MADKPAPDNDLAAMCAELLRYAHLAPKPSRILCFVDLDGSVFIEVNLNGQRNEIRQTLKPKPTTKGT